MSDAIERILLDLRVVLQRHMGRLEAEARREVARKIREAVEPNNDPETKPRKSRSGWLKGVPRNPKTPSGKRLLEDYQRAGKAGFIPLDLDDLVRWAQANPTGNNGVRAL